MTSKTTRINAIVCSIAFLSLGIYLVGDYISNDTEPNILYSKPNAKKTSIVSTHNGQPAKQTSQMHSDKGFTNTEPTMLNTEGTSKKILTNIKQQSSLKKNVLREQIGVSVTRLLHALESPIAVSERATLIDQFLADAIIDEYPVHLLSDEISSQYRETNSIEIRSILADLMIILPGEGSQKLGRELFDSTSHEQRLLGLELMRSDGSSDQLSNQDLMTDAIWTDENENVSATAIDILDTRINNTAKHEYAVSELNNIIDAHSSDTVRASALLKMSDIDQSQITQDRLSESLDSNSYTLQMASALAIKRNGIASPKVHDGLVRLANEQNIPKDLQALVNEILYEHAGLYKP